MPGVMQPLKDEHREMLPHIETLRAAAEAIGALSTAQQRRLVTEAHNFLTQHLLPHAEAEEAALYPAVARILGADGATATMSRDHVEVGRLIEELGGLKAKLEEDEPDFVVESSLRRVLYGLHAVVSLHFAKEEEVYVPLLEDALSDEEAQRLFEAMGHAAGEARAGLE